MTWEHALEAVVARTRHERYRALCADAHPDRGAWRAEVVRLAAAGPRPSVAESLARTRGMRSCPFRSTDRSCGCSGGRCALRRGASVSHLDCFDCLSRYPDTPTPTGRP